MPKLEANLQFMFNEYDLLDRYDAAATLGFKGVELQNPYTLPVEQIVQRLNKHDLKHIIINAPVTDPETGGNNLGLQKSKRDLYEKRMESAVEYATKLGCLGVNVGIGQAVEGLNHKEMYGTLVENLSYASEALGKVKVKALVEAINTRDQPNFLIHTTEQARNLIRDVGHGNLYIQYDFYHMQIMEGDLALTVEKNIDLIAHMQLADTPGRHEPGTGEINFEFLLPFLDSIGYEGWVGCEYYPSSTTAASLEWAQPWL